MIKNRLLRAITVAGFSAGMLIAAGANAEYMVPNMPAIVGYTFSDLPSNDGFPLTRSDWVKNPTKYSWNPINAREGKHPDRDDGVVYIFKNATDANAWWDGITGEPPAGVPDKAVAYVHWALDNNSGLFPGIMAMTDDIGFQNNNCIMSSGLLIIDSETGEPTKKTCDNPPASAKRFKLVILQADEPIDIVFNMTTKDLTYFNYSDPPEDVNVAYPDSGLPAIEDITDDIFRNYRYLMKVGNGTGTDTVAGARTGTRLTGVKVELGFTDLNTGAFDPTDGGETLPGDGLLFETDQCVAKRYWDIAHDHDIGQTDYCLAQLREVFLPHEFATFSPGMFASVGDARSPLGGYWDLAPAGLEAPANQDIKPQSIESSVLTDNYFGIAANQAVSANPAILGNVFGSLMDYGVIADGDPGTLSMGIYKDDDGDPSTEGSLYVWWDGSNYRWGVKGGPELQSAWSIVSDADLAEMEARPLSETVVLDPPRYEFGYMDDLAGLNMDTFIKITPAYDVQANPTFTVRLTGLPASAGTADGPWVGNEPDTSAFEPDATVDPGTTTTSSDGGSSGFSLSWITAALLALGLLLRRRRF
jgi:MYXO-CTERM domain-containing protein